MTGKITRINGGSERREEPKVGRNDPCPCGSGKKHKKCCDAPINQRPPCSVDACLKRVKWFLAPSINGARVQDRYWVACEDHAQPISKAAAEEGLDIHVIPMDSLMGKTIGEVDPVAGPGAEAADAEPEPDLPGKLSEKIRRAQDEILANTIIKGGEHDGQKYRDVHGDPPYDRSDPPEPEFEPPRIWTPPGVR
jgi:hypothetical protein